MVAAALDVAGCAGAELEADKDDNAEKLMPFLILGINRVIFWHFGLNQSLLQKAIKGSTENNTLTFRWTWIVSWCFLSNWLILKT